MENSTQKPQIAISVKNVSKTFIIPHDKISTLRGAFTSMFNKKDHDVLDALKDISFEIKKGEFFGIIGRNGSGKSTLLKILAGVYAHDTGSIEINGAISPFLELGIGFNPELSGRDNIYLNATVLGLTKKQIDKKFDSIVAFSELERFIDQKLKNYSSGMSVRLAFSVSIHANRDILLMDEVLAVGDVNFQSKCLNEFNKYKEMGKTVILVVHDVGTIQRYCDRAMLLRNGKIEMIGKADEVGNEYIYQNMSDEEKRIKREQEQERIGFEKERIQVEKEAEKLKGKELEEEKKRIENEKIKLEEERKNKVAEITSVEFLDKSGNVKNVFETGEPMGIKVDFKIHREVKLLNFGIGMHSAIGGCIFGYNTQIDKSPVYRNDNFVVLSIDELSLLKGEYFINVTCFGEVAEHVYDFKPKCKILTIYSTGTANKHGGFFLIKHEWKKPLTN